MFPCVGWLPCQRLRADERRLGCLTRCLPGPGTEPCGLWMKHGWNFRRTCHSEPVISGGGSLLIPGPCIGVRVGRLSCNDLCRTALVMKNVCKGIPHPVKNRLVADARRGGTDCRLLSSPGQLTGIHEMSSLRHRSGKVITSGVKSQVFLSVSPCQEYHRQTYDAGVCQPRVT